MSDTKPIHIITKDGLNATFVDQGAVGTTPDSRVLVRFEDGREALVPAAAFVLQGDGSYYVPLSRNDIEGQQEPV